MSADEDIIKYLITSKNLANWLVKIMFSILIIAQTVQKQQWQELQGSAPYFPGITVGVIVISS